MDEFYAKLIKDFEMRLRKAYREAREECHYIIQKEIEKEKEKEKEKGLNKTN